MRTVKEMWTEFSTAVLKDVAPDSVQALETERAFYSGVFSAFCALGSGTFSEQSHAENWLGECLKECIARFTELNNASVDEGDPPVLAGVVPTSDAPGNVGELLQNVLRALERPDVTTSLRCATLANALVASCKIGGVEHDRMFGELEKIWEGLEIRVEGQLQ